MAQSTVVRILALFLVLASAAPGPLLAQDGPDASPSVSTIATGGNPASLVVYGDGKATAVLADGTILGARTRVGQGRVSALGHGGFLGDARGDTRAYLLGELTWLCEGSKVRAWGLPKDLGDAMGSLGITVERVEGTIDTLEMGGVDLIVGSPQRFARSGRLDDLRGWLEDGGAMLAVETAWGQIQLGHAQSVDDLAANRLLSAHGICFTGRALTPARDGLYHLSPAALEHANATRALRVLGGEESGDIALAGRIVREALASVPMDSPLIDDARAMARVHRAELDEAYASMRERPLTLDEHPLACALLDLDARLARHDPLHTPAHPSHAAFPGAVPDELARVSRVVDLRDGIGGWRSTGLYAPAGETIRVRVEPASAEGISVQIGCWLDPQHFDARVRMTPAVFRADVREGVCAIRSPIGGPLYIDVPVSLSAAGGIRATIEGAVEMPHFRLGHTDLDQWRTHLRGLPVAWAELESDELVLTIPADSVRDLDRPDQVMEHWDRVHRVMQEMEPRSPRHWPDRQYRYVADRRLSWGYMYCPSNAPIVIPMSAARAMVQPENFDGQGPNRLWGHYHEMGHSHQNPLWTFGGTGEVTVNIFTVLALHKVNGYPLDDEATRTSPEQALRTMREHMADGAPFDRWKSRPFLALQTYAMLWHEFGWDAFRSTFRSYDDLAADQRPRTDAEKRDEFAIRMSRAVGRNLEPYFRAWGIPLSDRVGREVGDLPVWMPEGIDAEIEAGSG